MIVIMNKEAGKNDINAVIKSLGKHETYISKVNGKKIIVVK